MQKYIAGKNINLRDVEIEDAEFILSLRIDEQKSKYLHKTEDNIEKQIDYIKSYKQKLNEWYFIIESKNKEQLGTVRIYDIQNDSFCWGSWLVKAGAPKTTAIESALLIYEYAFYTLGFKKSHFDVRKGNEKVIAFHKRLGADITNEDEQNFYFKYDLNSYEIIKPKYNKFLC